MEVILPRLFTLLFLRPSHEMTKFAQATRRSIQGLIRLACQHPNTSLGPVVPYQQLLWLSEMDQGKGSPQHYQMAWLIREKDASVIRNQLQIQWMKDLWSEVRKLHRSQFLFDSINVGWSGSRGVAVTYPTAVYSGRMVRIISSSSLVKN
jgi:hypothetical protein